MCIQAKTCNIREIHGVSTFGKIQLADADCFCVPGKHVTGETNIPWNAMCFCPVIAGAQWEKSQYRYSFMPALEQTIDNGMVRPVATY